MPNLQLLDATQILPQLNHIQHLLDDYESVGVRFRDGIEDSLALRGEAREALLNNGITVADRFADINIKMSQRLEGMRRSIEHGADVAGANAHRVSSIEIPDFL